jgi:hypothetical protein
MRCVSYTRSVSGCPTWEVQQNAIGQQNEAIKNYLKRKGWKLAQKYSDRKQDRDEDTAFLEMKKDGMERKFDCVVVSSMFYCGKSAYAAADVLYTVFYPCGIHFAVVEDDFCSADVSHEEVEAYIKKVRAAYMGEITYTSIAGYMDFKSYNKYGYIWVTDDEVVIDPAPAKVVKEIFEWRASGISIRKIAKRLNERGEEDPIHYRLRMRGRDTSRIKPGWKDDTVSRLLKWKLYTGEWERRLRGENYTLSCPVIIEPALFDKVNAKKGTRKNSSAKTGAPYKCFNDVFSKCIVDKETEHALNIYTQVSSGEKIFRFKYPGPQVTGYKRHYISYEIVEREVARLLALEKKKVQIFEKQIESGAAVIEKERQQRLLRNQAMPVFEKMAGVEKELMAYSRAYETEEMSDQEYDEKRERLIARQMEYDAELQQYLSAIKDLEIAFSEKNPWLKLFQDYSEHEPLTSGTVKKYLALVLVYRFQTVEIVTKHQEWTVNLPQAWFADLEMR